MIVRFSNNNLVSPFSGLLLVIICSCNCWFIISPNSTINILPPIKFLHPILLWCILVFLYFLTHLWWINWIVFFLASSIFISIKIVSSKSQSTSTSNHQVIIIFNRETIKTIFASRCCVLWNYLSQGGCHVATILPQFIWMLLHIRIMVRSMVLT